MRKAARAEEHRADWIRAFANDHDTNARTCLHARDDAANAANSRRRRRRTPRARVGMRRCVSCSCLAYSECCGSAPGKQVTHPLHIARRRRNSAIHASSVVAQHTVCTPSKWHARATRGRRARALAVGSSHSTSFCVCCERRVCECTGSPWRPRLGFFALLASLWGLRDTWEARDRAGWGGRGRSKKFRIWTNWRCNASPALALAQALPFT